MTLEHLVDQYIACWMDMETSARLSLLETLLSPDAFYCDPTIRVVGANDLAQHISGVVKQRPGAKLERTSQIDAHHDVARFGWNLVQADGQKLPESIDVIWLNADRNKLTGILGFFGPLKK